LFAGSLGSIEPSRAHVEVAWSGEAGLPPRTGFARGCSVAPGGLSCAPAAGQHIRNGSTGGRGMTKRRGAWFTTGVLMAILLSASIAHAQKKTLVIALNQDPDILDPTLSRTYVGRIIYAQMCEKLYDIDANLKIFPQLAAELPVFTDGGKTV